MDSPKLDNGKGSASPERTDRGFRPTANGGQNGIIKVQPPRREDLQPSYAQTLQGETEAETHGWYGSMSKSSPIAAWIESAP
jgi:erythrocyte band 7 integral membrane protein